MPHLAERYPCDIEADNCRVINRAQKGLAIDYRHVLRMKPHAPAPNFEGAIGNLSSPKEAGRSYARVKVIYLQSRTGIK